MAKGRKAKDDNLFGSALGEHIAARGLTQSDLSRETKKSQPYINMVVKGHRAPAPEWINLVADTLGLPKKERARLHYAAAKDQGYELPDLDLTKK